MALTFPLSLEAFLDRFPVQEYDLDVTTPLQATGLDGGAVLTAETAPPFWAGYVSLAQMKEARAAEAKAILAALSGPGRTFYFTPPHRPGPANDPAGGLFEFASVTLHSYSTAENALRLEGLPPGFVLSPGDLVSVIPAADPSRPSLFRFLEGATAGAGGDMPALAQVVPHIRPGAFLAGAQVSLYRPRLRAMLVPGSVSAGNTVNRMVRGLSFEFRQAIG